MRRRYTKLSIVHPKAKWLTCFFMAAFVGMILGIASLKISQDGSVEIGIMASIWLSIYCSSVILFLYVRLGPKYKRCLAGEKNLIRTKQFLEDYPEIAMKLNREEITLPDISYKELKKFAVQANKELILLKANDFIESAKVILPRRSKK